MLCCKLFKIHIPGAISRDVLIVYECLVLYECCQLSARLSKPFICLNVYLATTIVGGDFHKIKVSL